MYRKYYSYNDMPVPLKKEAPKVEEKKNEDKAVCVSAGDTHPCEKSAKKSGILGGFPGKLETDDIILIVVILVLLMDECEDKMLLAAIAFVLFAGWGEK